MQDDTSRRTPAVDSNFARRPELTRPQTDPDPKPNPTPTPVPGSQYESCKAGMTSPTPNPYGTSEVAGTAT